MRLYSHFAMIPLLAAAVLSNGCAKQKLIPNTRVRDTEVNRQVLRVVERYRRAMEKRDSVTILALVHPTYRDNSGTPEAADDLDYKGVRRLLKGRFQRTTRVRYQLEYQDVELKGREAFVEAWIDATFVYEEPNSSTRWRRFTDYSRFRLLNDGKAWRFISGL